MAFAFFTPAPINHLKCGSSDSSNFTYPVSGTYPRLATVSNGGRVQNANGYDIRPYADSAGTTPLDFELVSYNATTGYIEMWVRVPTLSHTVDTPIYLLYADPGIATNGSVTTAWDSNLKGGYHLGDGTTLSLADSTSNALSLTNHSATATTGQVGGGAAVSSGSSQYLFNGSIATSGATAGTLSAWLKGAGTAGYAVSLPLDTTGQHGWELHDTGSTYEAIMGDGSSAYVATASVSNSNDGNRHHVVLQYNGSTVAIFIDGVSRGSVSGPASIVATAHEINLGRFGTFGAHWSGSIDEVRVSTGIARSADWILAEYNSQSSPSTFYTFGTEQAVGGTIASGAGLALSPSQALALGVAIAFGGGSAASASLAYAIAAPTAAGAGNAPSQSLSRAAGAVIASVSGVSFSTSVGFGNSSAIIIATGTAASVSASSAFAAAVAIASGTGAATSASAAAAAGSSIASGVGNAPSVSVAIAFGASFVFGTGASQSVTYMRGVALGTATVPPFYPPGRFTPDTITARFAADDITATFTPILSTQ